MGANIKWFLHFFRGKFYYKNIIQRYEKYMYMYEHRLIDGRMAV